MSNVREVGRNARRIRRSFGEVKRGRGNRKSGVLEPRMIQFVHDCLILSYPTRIRFGRGKAVPLCSTL